MTFVASDKRSAPDARCIPLFPTPMFSSLVEGHAALNSALLAQILKHREGERGVSKSNVHGWQSNNHMTRWGGRPAETLAAAVVAMAAHVTADVKGDATRKVRWRPEMWANASGSGASNQTHWHPGSYLSAVYYVDDGYAGSADTALGGELVFIDPRMPFLRMGDPELARRGADGSAPGTEAWLRPRSGLLVMFPSFLGHSVRPYLGTGLRVSIAINLVAAFEPAAAQ
ncbi:TIGR02466 family protein [Sphingomonas sp. ASY06-1R]|uniref:TIGR02466 family protein n=1 Tax=Sphingomonas sp. ASY06-1R TaxID=3445771 RepID=UPI003FA1F5D0